MLNAKKGLELLTISIVLQIVFIAVIAILVAVSETVGLPDDILAQMTTTSSAVALSCFVVEVIGVNRAGEDSRRFRSAGKLAIAHLILEVLIFILEIVANATANIKMVAFTMSILIMVLTIATAIILTLILFKVIKGCSDMSRRAMKISKVVIGTFIPTLVLIVAYVVFEGVVSYLEIHQSQIANIISIVILVLALVTAVAFLITFIIMIFRTVRNVNFVKKKHKEVEEVEVKE